MVSIGVTIIRQEWQYHPQNEIIMWKKIWQDNSQYADAMINIQLQWNDKLTICSDHYHVGAQADDIFLLYICNRSYNISLAHIYCSECFKTYITPGLPILSTDQLCCQAVFFFIIRFEINHVAQCFLTASIGRGCCAVAPKSHNFTQQQCKFTYISKLIHNVHTYRHALEEPLLYFHHCLDVRVILSVLRVGVRRRTRHMCSKRQVEQIVTALICPSYSVNV